MLQSASPQVRALKRPAAAAVPAEGAAAAAAGGAAVAATPGVRPPLTRFAKKQLAGALTLLFMSLLFGFGMYGPNGALTATAMCTFLFLVLP